RQVMQLPSDAPIVEHAAELFDGAVEEGLLFGGKLRRREREKLGPIGIATEEFGVPPHVARLDRLALGGGEVREHALRQAENRLRDKVAAEGGGGHRGLGACGGVEIPMTRAYDAMGTSSAPPSLNQGAGRCMVPFDHIAVMGICGLRRLDTLRLQISLIKTMISAIAVIDPQPQVGPSLLALCWGRSSRPHASRRAYARSSLPYVFRARSSK